MFGPSELVQFECQHGRVCSVVGRTTRVKVLLLVRPGFGSGMFLQGSNGRIDENELVSREAWATYFLRNDQTQTQQYADGYAGRDTYAAPDH
jgi:hypothetical protein